MNEKNNSRRQFIKNASLIGIGSGLLPLIPATLSATELKNNACDPTTLDYYGEGPFYTQNPPDITNGILAPTTEPGKRMIISGRVTNMDCTEFISDAIIDIWHADDSGAYDNVGYKLRGKTKTNSQGYYMFETIKPGKYLNGSQFRPSHIHFKITAPGKNVLTTQLYFKGDTSIPIDAAASISSGTYDASSRIIELKDNGSGTLEGTWDIVVVGTGGVIDPNNQGTAVSHIDKGMIYKTFPNPFVDELIIQYGVFNPSRVNISIFDYTGNLVANLETKDLQPEKYEAVWRPPTDLPQGHYFVALKLNELQVHYLKVMKH